MKTFKIKFTRSYVTYVDINAQSETEAMDKFEQMCDDGSIYQEELEQMNIEDEDITIISEKDTFKVGDRVSHDSYGIGVVVDYVDNKQIYVRFGDQPDEDVVDFDDTELKKGGES